MKEFVLGTDAQYEMLKQSLNDDRCHTVRENMGGNDLEVVCSDTFRRLYKFLILYGKDGSPDDSRVARHGRDPAASRLLKSWLKAGTLKFLDYTDMKVFLRSLTYLY